MPSFSQRFEPFAKRLQDDQAPPLYFKNFQAAYAQLCEGETGLLPNLRSSPLPHSPTPKNSLDLPKNAERRHLTPSKSPQRWAWHQHGTPTSQIPPLRQTRSLLSRYHRPTIRSLAHPSASDEQFRHATRSSNGFSNIQNSVRSALISLSISYSTASPSIRQDNLSPCAAHRRRTHLVSSRHGIYLALITSGVSRCPPSSRYPLRFCRKRRQSRRKRRSLHPWLLCRTRLPFLDGSR